MKIKKAKIQDARRIVNLRKKTFETLNSKDYTKKQINELNKLSTPDKIIEKIKKRDMFCMINTNKILGVIDLEENKIGGFFIRKGYINKGIGTKLIKFIEDYARKKGIRKIILYSTPYAISFYKKLGYQKSKKQSKKLRVGNVIIKQTKMEKKLK